MNFLRTGLTMALMFLLIGCGGTPSNNAGDGTAAPTTKETKSAPAQPLPFNASGLLAGTAAPKLPDGEPGKVSVVQIGPLAEPNAAATELLIAFRNNTSEGISHVDWTGTARSGGSIVATGSSQGTIPAQIQPGEIGLAYVYFDGAAERPPADADFEFTVKTSPTEQSPYNTAPLKVTEANASGDAIVGAASNQTGESVAGPFSVSVYCFDGDELVGRHGAFAEQDGPIDDSGQVTFTASLFGAPCPTFAVGVGGWFEN